MFISLRMPEIVFRDIKNRLLPTGARNEEAGFVFARAEATGPDTVVFQYLEWWPLEHHNFEHQSQYHLELQDGIRARIIKHAHDLECSLVEFHSHPGPWPAQFSPSDFRGLSEFVPHVWWRLKGRPYAAVVMASNDLDGLAWTLSPKECHVLAEVHVGRRSIKPTGLSIKAIHEGRSWKG